MVDVITVLKNQERFAADQARADGRPAPARGNWLASHPSNDQRLETITQLASQYKDKAGYDDEGRARYLKLVQGMHFGESADQGLVRGLNFYHAGLGFALTAPTGWTMQNSADQLGVLNAARDATLVLRVVPASAGTDAATIIRNVLKPSQGRTEAVTLNGLRATRFVGTRQNAQGQLQPVEATVVNGPGTTNYLLLSAGKDDAALQRARPALRDTEMSFRAITAQDRSAARAWVLKTVPYPKGGFTALAKTSPIDNPEKQLRLINGYYGGGEPQVGQWVKVVEML
jgi:predicted Zn-dependent protease